MRAPKETVNNARRLRRNLSPPEARLWIRLRARIPGMPVFRRQHPIGPYVIDFYCATARLAVEVDGIGHDMGDRPQRDLRRDAWLRAQGVSVMRVPASEVMRAIDDVVDAIVRAATAKIAATLRAPPPRCARFPSPAMRGRMARSDFAEETIARKSKNDPDQLGPLRQRHDEDGQGEAGVSILPCEAGEGDRAKRGGGGEQ